MQQCYHTAAGLPDTGDGLVMIDMTCRVCGNSESNQTCRLRELMFGLNEIFDYFQCSQSSTLEALESVSGILSEAEPA